MKVTITHDDGTIETFDGPTAAERARKALGGETNSGDALGELRKRIEEIGARPMPQPIVIERPREREPWEPRPFTTPSTPWISPFIEPQITWWGSTSSDFPPTFSLNYAKTA